MSSCAAIFSSVAIKILPATPEVPGKPGAAFHQVSYIREEWVQRVGFECDIPIKVNTLRIHVRQVHPSLALAAASLADLMSFAAMGLCQIPNIPRALFRTH